MYQKALCGLSPLLVTLIVSSYDLSLYAGTACCRPKYSRGALPALPILVLQLLSGGPWVLKAAFSGALECSTFLEAPMEPLLPAETVSHVAG